jgi:molybdopterin-guanine dinucleotide biosynthesis protein A
MQIAGLILAGGASRRMRGTEKAFLTVGGISMLARIVQSLDSQCTPVLLSTGGDPEPFSSQGLTVISDTRSRGPMLALAEALDQIAQAGSGATHVLSVPCDTPFLPSDLCARLAAALAPDSFAACASSNGRLHPVIGLWPLAARRTLQEAAANGKLSFHAALEGQKIARVEWQTQPRDPFFNVNTPEDLILAQGMLSQDQDRRA